MCVVILLVWTSTCPLMAPEQATHWIELGAMQKLETFIRARNFISRGCRVVGKKISTRVGCECCLYLISLALFLYFQAPSPFNKVLHNSRVPAVVKVPPRPCSHHHLHCSHCPRLLPDQIYSRRSMYQMLQYRPSHASHRGSLATAVGVEHDAGDY